MKSYRVTDLPTFNKKNMQREYGLDIVMSSSRDEAFNLAAAGNGPKEDLWKAPRLAMTSRINLIIFSVDHIQ